MQVIKVRCQACSIQLSLPCAACASRVRLNILTPVCVQQPKQLDPVFTVLMRGLFPCYNPDATKTTYYLSTCTHATGTLRFSLQSTNLVFWKAVPCQSMASNAEVAHRGPTTVQAISDLFALQRIHQDIFFCNDDYVASEKAKAINRMIEKLCSELQGVCCMKQGRKERASQASTVKLGSDG